MPYSIKKRGKYYQVVTTATDKVHGTFLTEEDAKKQLAAIYANAAPETERKKKK